RRCGGIKFSRSKDSSLEQVGGGIHHHDRAVVLHNSNPCRTYKKDKRGQVQQKAGKLSKKDLKTVEKEDRNSREKISHQKNQEDEEPLIPDLRGPLLVDASAIQFEPFIPRQTN